MLLFKNWIKLNNSKQTTKIIKIPHIKLSDKFEVQFYWASQAKVFSSQI